MNYLLLHTQERPSPAKRLAMFLLLALPGAGLAAEGGAGLGAALASGDAKLSAVRLLLVGLFLAGSSRLLLLGTRTVGRPLFLLVLLPMPILLAAGYELSLVESASSVPFGLVGMTMPLAMYPLVRAHYRRREGRTALPPVGSPPPSLSTLDFQPIASCPHRWRERLRSGLLGYMGRKRPARSRPFEQWPERSRACGSGHS